VLAAAVRRRHALRERCDHRGAYLVLDEVICGFGRLGQWQEAQHFGVRTDLDTFAKAATSGYLPLGGEGTPMWTE
jgi:adenosylmethionine-8-amino-7-oxononanoate aminotransferase